MHKSILTSEDGATAVEFALLVIPFVFLMIAIIELAIMYGGATLLEGATNSAARLLRTGQIQQGGGDPEAVFRDAMCEYTTALIRCNDITIEAIPLASFADADDNEPEYDVDGNMISHGFDAGGSNGRMLVRASYNYTMLTPFIGPLLAGNSAGRVQFISTIAFQTEPYNFEN